MLSISFSYTMDVTFFSNVFCDQEGTYYYIEKNFVRLIVIWNIFVAPSPLTEPYCRWKPRCQLGWQRVLWRGRKFLLISTTLSILKWDVKMTTYDVWDYESLKHIDQSQSVILFLQCQNWDDNAALSDLRDGLRKGRSMFWLIRLNLPN